MTGREVDLAGSDSFLEGVSGLAQSAEGSGLAVVEGTHLRLLDPQRLTSIGELTDDGDMGLPVAFARDGTQVAYTVGDTVVVRSTADSDAPSVRLARSGQPRRSASRLTARLSTPSGRTG